MIVGNLCLSRAAPSCYAPMQGNQNIFLVGPMGSGKTAVGRKLAQLLGLSFIDSDHEIEQLTGADREPIAPRDPILQPRGRINFRGARQLGGQLTAGGGIAPWPPIVAQRSNFVRQRREVGGLIQPFEPG